MQTLGPAGIPKTSPGADRLAHGVVGEGARGRPPLAPLVPCREDPADRGLLQHDLADVHTPGSLSRQGVHGGFGEPVAHDAIQQRHDHILTAWPTRANGGMCGLLTVAVASSLLNPVGPEPAKVYWRRRSS